MLERNFRQFAVNLPWQHFDTLINFKMAAFINFEAATASNSKSFNLQSYQFLLATIFQAFINYDFLKDRTNVPRVI